LARSAWAGTGGVRLGPEARRSLAVPSGGPTAVEPLRRPGSSSGRGWADLGQEASPGRHAVQLHEQVTPARPVEYSRRYSGPSSRHPVLLGPKPDGAGRGHPQQFEHRRGVDQPSAPTRPAPAPPGRLSRTVAWRPKRNSAQGPSFCWWPGPEAGKLQVQLVAAQYLGKGLMPALLHGDGKPGSRQVHPRPEPLYKYRRGARLDVEVHRGLGLFGRKKRSGHRRPRR